MASIIDVKTLSKSEIINLVKDLLESKIITRNFLSELADISDSEVVDTSSMEYIESLIDKHFEEYDEVFRKLA
ncbi:MAG: hypothetical protein H7X99_07955 [Saprospiraceae bacterium]|nr:hypothetical protein [Saprospiraceae bacterium]